MNQEHVLVEVYRGMYTVCACSYTYIGKRDGHSYMICIHRR